MSISQEEAADRLQMLWIELSRLLRTPLTDPFALSQIENMRRLLASFCHPERSAQHCNSTCSPAQAGVWQVRAVKDLEPDARLRGQANHPIIEEQSPEGASLSGVFESSNALYIKTPALRSPCSLGRGLHAAKKLDNHAS